MAKRVLVVDDQAYLRDVQVLLLEEAGYAATAFATGTEALEHLPDVRPDLILLDLSMPGMDGRQFLRRLRATQRWASVPVIVTTGLGDEARELRGGSLDILAKPFTDIDLLSSVRRLIGEPS